ncbi:MAG: ATP-dependent protease ATPase subunit HslU [Clostridia bacterium]|nr:ATP-dependent protease ATPase subunit HslU [Clostridia bacterium]MBQ7224427.1 ATP-dependent protease ATPase subunit HslU [Clostridia bacterium]
MELTPKQIVAELDRYIIGQTEAKRAVAIALRNRYRRSQLPDEIREEITPKNIIMQGPTGVGKTEIARRLAKLVKAPFVKVEATKFTEVGYVGRDVESMIRDLVEVSIRLVKDEKMAEIESKSREVAVKKIVDAITVARKKKLTDVAEDAIRAGVESELAEGKLDNHMLEIEVNETTKPMEIPGTGAEINIGEIFGGMMPKKKKKRKVTVKEAIKILTNEESEKHIDNDSINAEGVKRAEQNGIIFIDEIDKIASTGGSAKGPDVSREGVQRDILPIVEGCTVMTKYGAIKTDYILFIASGAFHVSSVTDLIPELQGRFPIRVELKSLTAEDFIKIFTVPENAITRQYWHMLHVDNINLIFTDEAIEEMAKLAELENDTGEDIGARRLHTIMESLLEDVSFNAGGDHPMIDVTIDKKYVEEHLSKQVRRHDLKKYIL